MNQKAQISPETYVMKYIWCVSKGNLILEPSELRLYFCQWLAEKDVTAYDIEMAVKDEVAYVLFLCHWFLKVVFLWILANSLIYNYL